MNRTSSRKAFTLIELLLVLVILSVLAAVVVPVILKRPGQARESGVRADIVNLKTALNTFHIDNARFPTTGEGLEALVVVPAGLEATWQGPYVERVPADKWGNPYIYRFPGSEDAGNFDLLSCGKDGMENTDDDLSR